MGRSQAVSGNVVWYDNQPIDYYIRFRLYIASTHELKSIDPLKYETFSINQLYLSSADCVRPKLSAEQELSQTVKVGILADDSHYNTSIAVSKASLHF